MWLDKVVKAIKESLIDKMKEVFLKLGTLEPMGIVVDKDGTIAFVPMPYKDNTEKKIITDKKIRERSPSSRLAKR